MVGADVVTADAPQLLLLADPLPAVFPPPARGTVTVSSHRVTVAAIETLALVGTAQSVLALITLLALQYVNVTTRGC